MKALEVNDAWVVGWKAVAREVGQTADYLTQANARGRLPVTPFRVGAQIAFTREMVAALRTELAHKGRKRRGDDLLTGAKEVAHV